MKIEQINIKNFRCFKDLTVDFNDKLNVIVGANASGKSSFLTALAATIERGELFLLSKHPKNDYNFSISDINNKENDNEKEFYIKTIISDFYNIYGDDYIGEDKNVKFETKILFNESQFRKYSNALFRLKSRKGIDDLENFVDFQQSDRQFISYSRDSIKLLEGQDKRIINNITLLIFSYYQSSRRLIGNPLVSLDAYQKNYEIEDAFVNSFDAANHYQNLFDWFFQRENQEAREGKEKNDYNFELPELKAMRQAIAKTITGVKKVFFDGTPPRLKVKMEDDAVYNIEELSDGYRNMLVIIMDFARRLGLAYPGYDNPLEAPAVLLIDEIELHLHPKWQQRVLPDLQRTFPNTQIFVTTHSPAIISTVRRENIIILDENHQAHKLEKNIGTYGADTQRILTEIFGANQIPDSIDTGKHISRYFSLIEDRNHEGDEAKKLRTELEDWLGADDPIFIQADWRIAQLKGLKK
ncbi:MAG: AAA family ATPase [Candidatus Symbiobacter sp.]|nr:AAA family ATPase [Candidatus Symbiobacter sp.]